MKSRGLRTKHAQPPTTSRHRLVVRTPGFHPGNRGSIPLGDAKIFRFAQNFEYRVLSNLCEEEK